MKLYSISYLSFFYRKLCNFLLKKFELPLKERGDIFFVAHNDRIGSLIQSHGNYEKEVLRCIKTLVERLDISEGLALDVGANIGNHTLYLSHIFAKVMAFEPSNSVSLVLKANVIRNRRDNIEVICCGLGHENGRAMVNELSSENTGMVELIMLAGEDNVDAINVCRGDDLIFDKGMPVRFVKIDVEGMEVSVLQGMKMCIERDKPLIAFESRCSVEGNDVMDCLTKMKYQHFYEVAASRLCIGKNFYFKSLLNFQKSYHLRKIDNLEDRHYSVVFASANEL